MKWISIIFIFSILLLGMQLDAEAQCAMCKAAGETNMQEGGSIYNGINKAIVYLWSAPYLVILTIAIIWYRTKKKGTNFLAK